MDLERRNPLFFMIEHTSDLQKKIIQVVYGKLIQYFVIRW